MPVRVAMILSVVLLCRRIPLSGSRRVKCTPPYQLEFTSVTNSSSVWYTHELFTDNAITGDAGVRIVEGLVRQCALAAPLVSHTHASLSNSVQQCVGELPELPTSAHNTSTRIARWRSMLFNEPIDWSNRDQLNWEKHENLTIVEKMAGSYGFSFRAPSLGTDTICPDPAPG